MIDKPEPKVTEVAVRSQPSFFPSPQEFSALKEQVSVYIKSGFLPQHIKSPEQAITIAIKGRELGIPPLQALSQIHVINGKPGMSAELMLALIRERCPGAVVEVVKSDDKACVIRASRPGHKPTDFSFTEADASRAGLNQKGGVWKAYPQMMLRARCVSSMARILFPDILGGASYTPEELGATLDSKGNIVTEISKAEIINAPLVEIAEAQPAVDFETYVIPVGRVKGKKLGEIPRDSLLAVQSFLHEKAAYLGGEEREFLRVLDSYLGVPSQGESVELSQEAKEVEGNHDEPREV